MTQPTEQQLDEIRLKAKKGYGRAEYELALLYMGDYFKLRAIYTIRALYKEFLRIYNNTLREEGISIENDLAVSYKNFCNRPSQNALNDLIIATIQTITFINPLKVSTFSSGISSGLLTLSHTILELLDRHYPEFNTNETIIQSAHLFIKTPIINSFHSLIESLTMSAGIKKDKEVVKKLLADAIMKGVIDAIKPLSSLCGYKSYGTTIDQNLLLPIFNGEGNYGYPSIYDGRIDGEIIVSDTKKLRYFKPFDYFCDDTDINHFILISYDKNNAEQRKAVEKCQSSILASIMAWVGPQGFTLDVIDFEHTGSGSYPAQFLSNKQVEIIVRREEWESKLNSLENLIEKRSKKMQSIFDYNRLHQDAPESFKIVVIRDYNGILQLPEESLSNHPSPLELEKYNKTQINVDRFNHLLENGYRFGIVFIIVSSHSSYQSSLSTIDCSETFFGSPYSFIRVAGVSHNEDNWLMKWLSESGFKTKDTHCQGINEVFDGSDGILSTELTEDGNDIEFQLDTISHTHTFVIGKTGSGKSVLLHNIITGLINKYSPEDLKLYLLDLKMGGVEFNRYRQIPHLRSLLVDNSDIQTVLEIMHDVNNMMKERGKLFRDTGVNNIKEYNRSQPHKKIPQVLIVIDECHQIFSMGFTRGSSKEQRAITEQIIKIAKEGRSQGIHLIFATQTLSGSEIPPDIQKNITDYFLLKCASSDSESLVRGSSRETETLPVGKVYYYHADRQALFQGKYNDNQTCEALISQAISRFSKFKNHGRIYFNGSQTFNLDRDTLNILSKDKSKGIIGSPGRLINLYQNPVKISLNRDYSENILITGINAENQSSRTAVSLLCSQIALARDRRNSLRIIVINCLDTDTETSQTLRYLSENECVSLYNGSTSGPILQNLCESVRNNNVSKPTLLFIFGQDRFGELKRDQKIYSEMTKDDSDYVSDLWEGITFSSPSESKPVNTFHEALTYLLENGPAEDLHTIIQIDKVNNLLFDEYVSAKSVSSRFKHLVVLRCDQRSAMSIGLSDELQTQSLSSDPERLRAYYYCDDAGEATLFSPYEMLYPESINNLLSYM